jgi:hypothetical protein
MDRLPLIKPFEEPSRQMVGCRFGFVPQQSAKQKTRTASPAADAMLSLLRLAEP